VTACGTSCEERFGKGDRQAEVVVADDGDSLGRSVAHHQVVGLFAESEFRGFQGRHGREFVASHPGVAGDVALGLGDVEAVALDGGVGTENDRVVLLVGVGVDLDDDALDEPRQVLREQAGEDILASGLDVLLPALHDDLPAFGVGAFEMPDESRHPFGQGEVTRGVGGVFQRRDGLLLGFFLVESVVGDDPEAEIRAESLGDRGVEFHFGGGILSAAVHVGFGRLPGGDGEGLFAFVEAFGERGGDSLPGFDGDPVFPGDELQLLHEGFGGVFADQFVARIVDARDQMVFRVVFRVGFGAGGRNIHFEYARARCAAFARRLLGAGCGDG